MQYDYEYSADMKLERYNPKTEKYARVTGLFGDEETAKKAAKFDLLRLQNLSKSSNIITARFSGAGNWETL